jgi:hypothetical protein
LILTGGNCVAYLHRGSSFREALSLRWIAAPLLLLLASLGLGGASSGCTSWKPTLPASVDPQTKPDDLLTHRTRSDGLVVDVIFIPLPEDADLPAIWRELDELSLERETREQLLINGIRVGICGIELPRALVPQSLDEAESADASLEQSPLVTDLSRDTRRIHGRYGQRYELQPRAQMTGPHDLFFATPTGMIGQTLVDPQPLLAMMMVPQEDGRVRFELLPEVQHGDVQQAFVGRDEAIRVESRREPFLMTGLEIAASIAEGQSIIIAPTDPSASVGEIFFHGKRVDGSPDRTAMVVRLVSKPMQSSLQ